MKLLHYHLAIIIVIVFMIPLCGPQSTANAEIFGSGNVIDGDTLTVSDTKIRLYGIDAPESEQKCYRKNKQISYPCGSEATVAFKDMIEGKTLSCKKKSIDRYSRILAVCRIAGAEGIEVNAEMVFSGWALAYRQYSQKYINQEKDAEIAQRGIWQGQFVKPWKWRRGKRLTIRPSIPTKCLIKGNISRYGRIYHLPNSINYKKTKIDKEKGEMWFCSEREAIAKGWRRAKQ